MDDRSLGRSVPWSLRWSVPWTVPVTEGETGAIGTNEVHGAVVVFSHEGIEAFGCFLGGVEGFGEVRGVITAATIGAGMTGLDFELEGILRACDVETTGDGAGFVVLVSAGFDVALEVFCWEDREEGIVEGNDPEVILVLRDTQVGVLIEVFPIEVEGAGGGDNSLEELEGAHGVLSLSLDD